MDLFHGIRGSIDFRINARLEYEKRVASKDTVLDIGGRNQQSRSNRRLRQLSSNSKTIIVSTDIIADYNPELVDDICKSTIESNSYDAIYCVAILEHVQDYEAAIKNIHRILKPGGELFVYVPFFYCFHDKMDYHRFTFTEVDRMLSTFSDHKLFLPDCYGYGGVFWQVITFYRIGKFPILLNLLSKCVNALLVIPLTLKYLFKYKRESNNEKVSLKEYWFYYTHLFINHGFCGWATKQHL
jgi:SAM-dependent methyltransferase